MPKQKKNRIGPARSASSMIRASTCRSGLSTVHVFAPISEKLIPSSIPLCQFDTPHVDRTTHLQAAVVLPPVPLSQTPSTSRLDSECCLQTTQNVPCSPAAPYSHPNLVLSQGNHMHSDRLLQHPHRTAEVRRPRLEACSMLVVHWRKMRRTSLAATLKP